MCKLLQRSQLLESKKRLETSAKLPQLSKTGCAGCGHLGASHRGVFLAAAATTENTHIGMGSGLISWNTFGEKLFALTSLDTTEIG